MVREVFSLPARLRMPQDQYGFHDNSCLLLACPTVGHRGDRFKPNVLQALLDATALCPIAGPPLRTLKGWTRRAELLEPVGITTALEFLDADDEAIRQAWGHSTTRAVKKARRELDELLDVKIVKKLGSGN